MNNKYICVNCKNQKKLLTKSHPFNTIFNKKKFYFFKCENCKITSIFPKLTKEDIDNLYDINIYHSKFYSIENILGDNKTFYNINKYINNDSFVLDYGCGNGSLLKKISSCTDNLFGTDVYENFENKNINIKYLNIDNFFNANKNLFDLIILRDVTEHLNEPIILLSSLSKLLSKKGIIYIEGPIEKGLSLVNFVIHINSFIKESLNIKNNFKPYHLSYFNLSSKVNLLSSIENLKIIEAKTYETGWPYDKAGFVKNIISKISKIFSYLFNNIFNIKYGNRFILILQNEKK